MKYASVCSGVEAATLAWHPLGWEPLWYSEIEPFPAAVLMHRFGATRPQLPLNPAEAANEKDRKLRESWRKQIAAMPDGGTIPNLGDMTKINGGKYRGKIDVLVGGTPCQSFSVAGARTGLEDTRGQLMLKFVELAYNCAVPWVVWENVPGVFSQDEGRAFQCLLSCLCGWDVPIPAGGWKSFGISTGMPGFFGVAWRVLDAQYVRVDGFHEALPQRRNRVFVVGYLGDWRPAAEVLFESQSVLGYTPPRRVKGKGFASDVERRSGAASEVGTIRCHGVIDSYADCYDGTRSCTLCARDAKGGQTVVTARNRTSAPALLCVHGSQDPIVQTDHANAVNRNNGLENCVYYESAVGYYPSQHQNPQPCETPCITAGNCNTVRGDTPLVQEVSSTIKAEPAVMVRAAFMARDTQSHAVARNECIPLDLRNASRDPEKHDAVNRQGVGIGEDGDPMSTVTASSVPGIGWRATVRRLLPVECERLMGFPDDYTKIPWQGKPPEDCPDAHRYKACGNSMCVNVMRWIGLRIAQVAAHLKEMG